STKTRAAGKCPASPTGSPPFRVEIQTLAARRRPLLEPPLEKQADSFDLHQLFFVCARSVAIPSPERHKALIRHTPLKRPSEGGQNLSHVAASCPLTFNSCSACRDSRPCYGYQR